MKLYLDDWRTLPSKAEGYESARTYEDFIMLIDKYSQCLDLVDLDYDLGYDSLFNGLDVLKYMNRHNIKCKHINVHSSHPSGRGSMLLFAEINFPDAEVTGY